MGRKKRDKRRSNAPQTKARKEKPCSKLPFISLSIFLAIIVAGAYACGLFSKAKTQVVSSTPFVDPVSYDQLIKLPPDQLAKVDIARMNLLCATGLPGAENLDIDASLKTLDQWAEYCRGQIESNLHQYYDNPGRFHNTEGYYRMAMLITVLKQDLRVHYDDSHPDDEPTKTFFANSDHLFIQGLLSDNRAGTCSAIPVLVTAIGRRLGYPLKLVGARRHSFVRWEDGNSRFNIEASNDGGMVSHPDDYYRTWPAPITDEMLEKEGYLKSMGPKEEVADFLATRAISLYVNDHKPDAFLICNIGRKLMPNSRLFNLN